MLAPAKVIRELLQLFGEEPKSTERVQLVKAADKLSMVEMVASDVVATTLLAFKQTSRLGRQD